MSSQPTRLLRLARTDAEAAEPAFVLVQISSMGPSRLDLKLVATEGSVPFATTISERKCQELKSSKFRGSPEQWKKTLLHVLGIDPEISSDDEDWKIGLEAVAAVADKGDHSELTVALRKSVGGIAQRLGTITLAQNDDEEIELFDWAGAQVEKSDVLQQQVSELQSKLAEAENTIRSLHAQLDDVVQRKSEHEDQLISKFALLLNEKKLKIRNQQRLLQTAQLEPVKAQELDDAMSSKQPRKAALSKASKRKPAAYTSRSPSDSSSDEFEAMDVDVLPSRTRQAVSQAQSEQGDESGDGGKETPEPLEDEEATADEESSDDEAFDDQPTAKESQPKSQGSTRVPPTAPQETNETPPPRRELPFAKGRRSESHDLRRAGGPSSQPSRLVERPSANVASAADDDEETEDDDEL